MPIIVYLDTQDYSRFGDVLRGKESSTTEKQFNSFEALKKSGDVVFAASMPLLGELFQYHSDYRETTLRKAEAVERLCGTSALSFPSRLVAAEIARECQIRSLLDPSIDTSVLSLNRYWYPNIADIFSDIQGNMADSVRSELSGMAFNRKLRRGIAKQASKIDFAKVAQEAAPEMAAEFGLPIEVFTSSIVAYLRGKITSVEASHRLFEHIAEPAKFVEVYFEKLETDRSLPNWMSKFGSDFQNRFIELRDQLAPYMKYEFAQIELEKMLSQRAEGFGQLAIKLGVDDTAEFGLDSELRGQLIGNSAFLSNIPACKIVGSMITAYVRQIMGLLGSTAEIEHSFGGDLVHALYLPHVDLWRGDRRFSALLREAMPQYASRVVSSPKDLLPAIEHLRSTLPHRSLDLLPPTP